MAQLYSFFLSTAENIFDHRNFLNFVHENNVDNTIFNYFGRFLRNNNLEKLPLGIFDNNIKLTYL